MKTYQEMAAAVFRRAEEYEQRQRRMRRRLCIAGSSAACFMLLLAGAALMQHRGKTPRRTKLFNPAIRALRFLTRTGKKAFGDLLYEGPFERALPVSNGEEAER